MSTDYIPTMEDIEAAMAAPSFPAIDPALVLKAAEEYDCIGEGQVCRYYMEPDADNELPYCRLAMLRGHYCRNDIAEVLREAARLMKPVAA